LFDRPSYHCDVIIEADRSYEELNTPSGVALDDLPSFSQYLNLVKVILKISLCLLMNLDKVYDTIQAHVSPRCRWENGQGRSSRYRSRRRPFQHHTKFNI
jgi:hypothetical protein